MQVLSIHSRYQIRGGEDESRESEERMLRENGHLVDVFEEDNRRVARLGLFRTGLRTVWSMQAYRSIRSRLQSSRYDLIHVQNFFPLISPSAYYAARAEGVPVIQTLRNYRLLCTNGLFFHKGRVCERCIGKIAPWLGAARACYRDSRAASAAVVAMVAVHRALNTWRRMVNVYVSLTHFARTKFIEGGLPADRIVVKPNFVHPDPGVGDGDGAFALLVCRLSREKGIETVLEAWRGIGHALPLKIVGDGPLASDVAQAARHIPAVQYLGRLPASQVYALMGQATCVVFPSEWYETFGRVAIESFAKGTPVIASRIGAIAEVVSDGRTGLLFEPGNPRDLADQVLRLTSSPAALARMRDNARREFLDKYTADVNHRIIHAIYHAAVHRSPLDRLLPQSDRPPANALPARTLA